MAGGTVVAPGYNTQLGGWAKTPPPQPKAPYVPQAFVGDTYSSGYDPYGLFMNQFNKVFNQPTPSLTGGTGMWQYNGAIPGITTGPAYNVGNAGLNFNQQAGLGNYNVGANVGQGTYNSDLLNALAGRVTTDMTNPDASVAMGLARDRIEGAGMQAQQALGNQYAGWGRGAGIVGAAQGQLASDIAKQKADAYRQLAMDISQQGITNATALEALRGGFFESGKGRELSREQLANQAYQEAMLRQLQNAGLISGAQLQNAGLGLNAYEAQQQRDLTGQTTGLDVWAKMQGLNANSFNDAQQRALQAAQLQNTMNQNNNNPAMLGQLANMLQWNAQNQYGQWQGNQAVEQGNWNAQQNAKAQQSAAAAKQQQDLWNWGNQYGNLENGVPSWNSPGGGGVSQYPYPSGNPYGYPTKPNPYNAGYGGGGFGGGRLV